MKAALGPVRKEVSLSRSRIIHSLPLPAAGSPTTRQPFASQRARHDVGPQRQFFFNTRNMVLPRLAGESATVIPALFIASILSSAPPRPPEMIAPACPIRRPGGAVRPAMKPTVGFFLLPADLSSAAAS